MRAVERFKSFNQMKKLIIVFSFTIVAFASAKAQQNSPVTVDVAFQLPALVSEKTVPMFDETFQGMPGVRIVAFCYNMDLIVFEVDRSVQPNDEAIHQKIHSIFKTDDSTLKIESVKAFNRSGYLVMCNETDLVTR